MIRMKKEKKPFKLNTYRFRKIKNGYLVTLDHGSWIFASEEEFRRLQRRVTSNAFFEKYENTGLILTEKSLKNIGAMYRKKYGFIGKHPGLHIIIPTQRCNMHCSYCHSEAKNPDCKEYDMSIETATRTVDFIFDTKSKNIILEFQGGEPLQNFSVVQYIVEYSKKKNSQLLVEQRKDVRYTLVTNLTLIDEKIMRFIKENNIDLTSSLDGPKEVHDKNRVFINKQGSYELVITAFRMLRDHGIPVGMLMTTTKDSLRYPKEIVNEYVKQGLTKIQVKPMNWIGYAKDEERYSPEEFISFWKCALEHIISLNKSGIKITERITEILLIKILTDYDPNFLDIRSPCGAVIGQVLYDQKGDIYTCDDGKVFDIFKIGSVYQDKYSDILTKPDVKAIIASSINDQYLCDLCAYKPYCGTCPVANYAEGGTPVPKLYKSYRCKIRKAQFDYLFEKLMFSGEDARILKSWIGVRK